MADWIEELNLSSFIIPSISFIIGWITKVIYENYTLKYKLKKEFEFEQKKKLKQDIAKNKVPLLNITEDFNHRLWNFNNNIDKNWHKVTLDEWTEQECYYIKSFVYRFLVLLHWTLKTEKDTISVDSTIADDDDITFLKYVKTFKDTFTNADLLKDLGYSTRHNDNHFYKNDLISYSKWVTADNEVIDFDVFVEKTKYEFEGIQKVINYFASIENTTSDKNLNVLRCFHLISINFLNKFGHSYQKTEKEKLKIVTNNYKGKIEIKKSFQKFILKSKLETELKTIIKEITKA